MQWVDLVCFSTPFPGDLWQSRSMSNVIRVWKHSQMVMKHETFLVLLIRAQWATSARRRGKFSRWMLTKLPALGAWSGEPAASADLRPDLVAQAWEIGCCSNNSNRERRGKKTAGVCYDILDSRSCSPDKGDLSSSEVLLCEPSRAKGPEAADDLQ